MTKLLFSFTVLALLSGAPCFVSGAGSSSVTGAAPQVQVDAVSLVRLTYENNLRVAAARFDVEAAQYQFQGFERNLSQFHPLVVESALDREVERDDGTTETEEEGRVSVGMTKEFFDGTRLGASTGMRQTLDEDGRNRNPFVELEARFPLFSSFTRLERITERSFEESEMLGSWLDFIETVRDAIADSQQAYFQLEHLLALRTLVVDVQADFDGILSDPRVADRDRDAALLRDQIQAYRSRLVELDGDIAAAHIRLIDRLGLDDLPLTAIATLDLYTEDFYGAHYLETSPAVLAASAVESDVEMRVMRTARDNAELKKQLAEGGRWDIMGRVVGGYDFASRGDDPDRGSGYRAGVALSIERNDPALLRLSLKRAEAEIRKYEARLAYRQRQITNEITRQLGQAINLRDVIRELTASRDLRRAVFAASRDRYLAGSESLENLIQARGQLFGTERDMLANLGDFFGVVINLDLASGAYFLRLDGVLDGFEKFGSAPVKANAPTPASDEP